MTDTLSARLLAASREHFGLVRLDPDSETFMVGIRRLVAAEEQMLGARAAAMLLGAVGYLLGEPS